MRTPPEHAMPGANDPYWWVAAPREAADAGELPAATDVAIIGAGYAGLSAALTLARAGRQIVVLDAGPPGFGGSSRSGGMVGHGHRRSYSKLKTSYGRDKALALVREGIASLEFTAELIAREKIDAAFRRVGRFCGARSAGDYDAVAREAELLVREVGLGCEVVSKADQHREIASDSYHGGVLYATHGGLHPALFHRGLLDVARQAGVTVIGYTPVERIRRDDGRFLVRTQRGSIIAREVIAATNGYTGGATIGLARRLIPVPSFLIATEPIGENRVRSLIPNLRMLVETGDRHLYYRPSPDGTRIIMGGRAALHAIPLENARRRMAANLAEVFPDLKGVGIAHTWTGNVAFTRTDLPGIGRRGGIWHALGCNGSGVAMMPYLGHKVALKLLGKREGVTAFDDIPFKAVPLYDGTPWFMPAVTYYYRARNRMRPS